MHKISLKWRIISNHHFCQQIVRILCEIALGWMPIIPFSLFALQWRHNGRDSVSNHQSHDCLLNRLLRRRSKKTSKLRVTGLCVGIHRGPVNSPHKWPVTRKMFPFDDVIRAICVIHCCPRGEILCDLDVNCNVLQSRYIFCGIPNTFPMIVKNSYLP